MTLHRATGVDVPMLQSLRSPHVLHAITDLNVGGAEYMLARFLERMSEHEYGHTVISLMPAGAIGPMIEAAGCGVTSAGMSNRLKPIDFVTLPRLARRVRPDLLHGWMYHGNLAATFISMLSPRPKPVVWSIHHTIADIAFEKRTSRRVFKLLALLSRTPAAISYCSRVAAADHERLGFATARAIVIPNGTNCRLFKPDPEAGKRLRSMLKIPAERLIVGHAARFHPMKDQTCLVRAVSRMVTDGLDVQCVFFGDGHVDGPVRAMANELGIGDRVTTVGVRDDLPVLLPGLDIFALCSAWGEAFSLAVSEAMACGVPAVVTDVGDTAWLVGKTGLAVPPRQPEALAAGLSEILRLSPESRQNLGRMARQRIATKFSLALYTERHRELYAEALARYPVRQRIREFV